MNVPHPADDLLRQYSVGQMSDESAGELERHLAECPQCEETLDNLAVSDETLISELRRPAVVDPVLEEPELRAALAQIVEHAAGVSEAAGESANEAEGREIGVYRLLEELGSGGMGTVYKALHTRLEKEVALKILATERLKDPQAVSRFDREMKAVGKLEHPHIVRAYDAGELEGQHFLVTEYVKGCDLSQLSRKLGPLPIADACELARQAALGLEEAHEHGMVHRDIKPANLFLARQKGRPPMVKVLDLGLALIAGEHAPTDELTGTGQIMGTIDYMAPEQAGDTHNVDIRADVYSLGATLYRLLTGSSIYRTDKQQSVMQKLTALATQPAPPLQSRRADAPDELAAVVHRMLEKDPAGRYATPADVVQALEPFCAGHDLKALLKPADVERTIADAEAAANSASVHDGSVETQDAVDPGLQPTLISTQEHVGGAETVVRPRSAGRGWTRWVLGAAAVAAILLGVILVQTKVGTIRIETNQTDVEVLVDGEKTVYITDPNDKSKIIVKIPKGAKTLRVRKAGFVANTEKFELETVEGSVKVSFVPAKDSAVGGDVDREVAEWVLGIGGSIATNHDHRVMITDAKELPEQPFRITGFRLNGNKQVSDEDLARLKGLRGLSRNIELTSTPVSDKGLAHLKGQWSILGLFLSSTQVGDGGLQHLKGMRRLQILQLMGTNVTDAGLEHLKGLRDLNSLYLDRTQVGDEGMKHLKDLPSLTTLHLNGTDVTEQGLRILKERKSLARLGLIGTKINDKSLEHLKELPELYDLFLESTQISDEGLEHLKALSKLTKVRLEGTKVTAAGVASLQKALPKCRISWDGGVIEPSTSPDREFAEWVLGIGGSIATDHDDRVSITDAKKLPEEPFHVTGFRLDGNEQVSDEDLARLKGLSDLSRNVNLGSTAIGDKGLEHLKGQRRIQGLFLSSTQVGDEGLQHLNGMRRLTTLQLMSTSVGDTGLEHLKGMPNLKSLYLDHTQVSDSGLKHLKHLPGLRTLHLNETDVTEQGLRHLKERKSLARLGLIGTKINDKSLEHLKELPELYDLFLDNTQIGDDGLEHLQALSKLTHVRLEGTKVTAAGVAGLHKALPNCRIEWDGGVVEPKSPQAKPWEPTAEQQAFIDRVAKLPAVEQVEAVRGKLREVNPGFDGAVTHKIEAGAVVEFSFVTDKVTEIWPVRALKSLRNLNCPGSRKGSGELVDLSPLIGLRLVRLQCDYNKVKNLSPLSGMPLEELSLRYARVTDLSPLRGMTTLRILNCDDTYVSDLAPLRGIPLTQLHCGASMISDLSVIEEMPLEFLTCRRTHIVDDSLIATSAVTQLYVDVPLFDESRARTIRSLELEALEGKKPDVFWNEYEARRQSATEFAESTLSLPAQRQLREVDIRLHALNPNHTPTPRIVVNDGAVVAVELEVTKGTLDLSPLMAFTKLRKLTLVGEPFWPDLSGLKHVPIEELNCPDAIAFQNSGVLKGIATLKTVNGKPAVEYWRELRELMKRSAKPQASDWQPTAEQNAFLDRVAKLPAAEQVEAVRAKLKEVNPGFDGAVTHKIEDGAVVEFEFVSDAVTEIWPVRGLVKLTVLRCDGSSYGTDKRLADLRALQGLPLRVLSIVRTPVSDLSPLKQMALQELDCSKTNVTDLSPLRGTTIETLTCSHTRIADLSALADLPLKSLNFGATHVTDLSPLNGKDVPDLHFSLLHVANLSALKTMRLKHVTLDVPLFDEAFEQLIGSLTLRTINGHRQDDFPTALATRRLAALDFAKRTSGLPVDIQLARVREKLKDVNPAFKLRLGVAIENDAIVAAMVTNGWNPDLSPLMAFPKLRKVTVAGAISGAGEFWPDLSWLKHVPLEELICRHEVAFANSAVLKNISGLKTINGQPANDYWRQIGEKVRERSPIQYNGAKPWIPTKEQQEFFDTVATLSPDEQAEAVRRKLMDVNPGYDGKLEYTLSPNPTRVFSVRFYSDHVTTIWPLRALGDLQWVDCTGSGPISPGQRKGKLADLKPLSGLRLNHIDVSSTQVSDLTPLRGMPLAELTCTATRATDLSPLQGMALTGITCLYNDVVDLSPLRGMPLSSLFCSATQVADLSPVAGMPLTSLGCSYTHIKDLSPLNGVELKNLAFCVPLFDSSSEEFIQSMKLERFNSNDKNYLEFAEFQKQMKARRAAAISFAEATSKLEPREQLAKVASKLRVTPDGVILSGDVVEVLLGLHRDTFDLSPLMAFKQMKKLTLVGKPYWPDLSGLKHVPIEELNCPDAIAFQNSGVLGTIATLKTINGKPAAEYWEELPGKMKPVAK